MRVPESDGAVTPAASLVGLFAGQGGLDAAGPGTGPGQVLTLACATVTVILAVFALVLLTTQLAHGSTRRPAPDQFRPVELAVIHGGHQLALWVVAALLRTSGVLGPDGRRVPGVDVPACDDTLVPAVLAGLGASQLLGFSELSTAAPVRAPLDALERRLQRLGMLTTSSTRHRLGLVMLVAEAVSALVLVELILTQRRHGPVSLLAIELVVLQLSVVVIVVAQLVQRLAARRLLRAVRASNPHLALAACRSWANYGPLAVPLATALHGAGALRAADPEFAALLDGSGGRLPAHALGT